MRGGGPFWARHYGFGAAGIRLGAQAHRPDPRTELADALQLIDVPTARLLRAAPLGVLLAVFLLIGLAALPFREEASDTQIVMLNPAPTVAELPEPLVEEPVPLPVAAEPEPIPAPPEPVVVEPPPKPALPPPPQIAEAPKPPPPPVRAPEPPPRARPAPVMPQAPAFAAKAPAEPRPTPSRVARTTTTRSQRPLPPPPSLAPVPDAAPADVPRISARTRSQRPDLNASRRSQAPAFAALAAPEAPVGETPPTPSRRSSARIAPRPTADTRRAPVAVAAAAPQLPSTSEAPRAARRAPTRPQPGSRPTRRSPALAAPAAPASTPPPARPTSVPAPVRAERRVASRPAREEQKLAGVPLGSLASCMSDREEDDLKRRLIATIDQPGRCQNRAGVYQFVETKNLNAFLMWVQRAPGRATADRCVELSLALDCVRERGVQESRG